MGASGRAMLRAMIEGQSDPTALAELARGRLREKRAALAESLAGRLNDHHRWLLGRLLAQVEFLEREIAAYDARLEQLMSPFEAALSRLDTIDGVGRRTAENLLAEFSAGDGAVSQQRRVDELGRDVSGQSRIAKKF
jgi:transposase